MSRGSSHGPALESRERSGGCSRWSKPVVRLRGRWPPRRRTEAGRAHVVGLTGPPGVGKSTTNVRAGHGPACSRGQRVGVLAVDPSSPFSGGALLGDRVRMSEHAEDAGVFIRSMATRGQLGGLAAATPQALRVLDAAGCDVVLIETVGVGQSEVDVVALADTTVGSARARHGRRGAGGQGGHPRGGRRVRRQQGRPRRRCRDRTRAPAHDREGGAGGLEGARPQDRGVPRGGDRQAGGCARGTPELGGGLGRGGAAARAARAEAEIEALTVERLRARIGRCGAGQGSRTWPNGSLRASWTPTRPPTSSSQPSPRGLSPVIDRGEPDVRTRRLSTSRLDAWSTDRDRVERAVSGDQTPITTLSTRSPPAHTGQDRRKWCHTSRGAPPTPLPAIICAEHNAAEDAPVIGMQV